MGGKRLNNSNKNAENQSFFAILNSEKVRHNATQKNVRK
jgi:hypothetical protein